jgi:hypothetical protein
MLKGMTGTVVLETDGEGVVRIVEDIVTDSYSIGLRTESKLEWKEISKELYDLLLKELNDQKGIKRG